MNNIGNINVPHKEHGITPKFDVGTRVNIISGHGTGFSGIIKEQSKTYNNGIPGFEYRVVLDGERNERVYFEYNLESEDILDQNINDEYIAESEPIAEHPEMFQENKPKFKIGDVVANTDPMEESYGPYFIKEVNFVDNGEEKLSEYVYEVGELSHPDEYHIFKEDCLILEYHDENWEQYVTESVSNGLPAWRGELYNSYKLYRNINHPEDGFTDEANDYYNDTLPPVYMQHILDRHTIYGRMRYVISSGDNKYTIMSKLKFDKNKLYTVQNLLTDKIEKMNGIGYVPGDKIHFTLDEIRLAEQIDLLDVEMRDGEQQYVDHFKLNLRNIDIMRMI